MNRRIQTFDDFVNENNVGIDATISDAYIVVSKNPQNSVEDVNNVIKRNTQIAPNAILKKIESEFGEPGIEAWKRIGAHHIKGSAFNIVYGSKDFDVINDFVRFSGDSEMILEPTTFENERDSDFDTDISVYQSKDKSIIIVLLNDYHEPHYYVYKK